MLKKWKKKLRKSSSSINSRSHSQHYTDMSGWKHREHWHLLKIPVPAVSHKCTQIPQIFRAQGALPVHTMQNPKCGNSQWMGQGLTPAGRASASCTRAEENSVWILDQTKEPRECSCLQGVASGWHDLGTWSCTAWILAVGVLKMVH